MSGRDDERTGSGIGHDRRTFLKRAAGALPGAAIAGSIGVGSWVPGGEPGSAVDGAVTESALDSVLLRAVADVALPATALDREGVADAVEGFLMWVDGFEPAAELDHPYLTGELRYGSPHPGPRWAAQLEAMDLESRRRSGKSLTDLTAEECRDVVETAVGGGESGNLPGNPALADHVAVGLLAWFYGTSQANDLCYDAEVGRHLCRGIQSLPQEPHGSGAAE